MRAAIALGSNLGDRLAHLREARRELMAMEGVGEPALASRVYETEPVGTEDDAGAFLNAVIEVDFTGEPAALLGGLQAIEAKLGRIRAFMSPAFTIGMIFILASRANIPLTSRIRPTFKIIFSRSRVAGGCPRRI